MTDHVTPFPGRRPSGAPPAEGETGRVLPFAAGEAPAPSLHETDVVVIGANPLLNALAVLAEVCAGRRVILVPTMGADDWGYELGVQATFHRFVDAAAETLYALSPSRRLDFRNTAFPDPDWTRLFQRLQERRRRILEADVLRLEVGVGLTCGLDGDRLRLVVGPAPETEPPKPLAELNCIRAACASTWESDLPRAVFAAERGQEQAIVAVAAIVTSADALAAVPENCNRIKLIGTARGVLADLAQKSDRAFDDVLAAIKAIPHPDA